MKSPADHPVFTAMALGEHIDGTPPQAVLDALHQNPAARREADAIRSTAQRLSSALGTSGSASLDPAARLAILTKAFRSLSPREAQYVVKILTGDTRLGLKEGLLEDAIANAFNTPPESVRAAHMLNGDLGTTAILARDGRLDDASLVPFQALTPNLSSSVVLR